MGERRRFIRIPENLPISYEVLPNTKTRSFLTKDISEEGIRFFIHKPLPKYSLLKIKLSLEKTSFCLEAIVRVKWVRQEIPSQRYEIGAEFINISKGAKEHLIDYIRINLKNK